VTAWINHRRWSGAAPYAIGLAVVALLIAGIRRHPHTDWASWITAVATLALALAAVAALAQLREVRRDRDIAVIADLGRRWDEDGLREARERAVDFDRDELLREAEKLYQKPRDKDAQRLFLTLLRIPNFFEDLPLITESGAISSDLVARGFKDLILDEWETWEPTIVRFQKDEPYSYTQFRKLVRDMRATSDEPRD
jgi:hypothetical protein